MPRPDGKFGAPRTRPVRSLGPAARWATKKVQRTKGALSRTFLVWTSALPASTPGAARRDEGTSLLFGHFTAVHGYLF